MSKSIKVLVIDDSALMRKLIPQMLERDDDIQCVGTAMDGEFGLKKIEELNPDVVTLDLDMPRMDGMETLRQITRRSKVAVIIVSSHSTEGASATFKALALGALDFVAKPRENSPAQMEAISQELIGKIKVAAGAKNSLPKQKLPFLPDPQKVKKVLDKPKTQASRIVAIGISTGGPNALQFLLSQLPENFPGGIVVVQHMPTGFTEMFAKRLNDCCNIEVKEAHSGDLVISGRALICPGNRHIRVKRMPLGSMVVLNDDPPVNGHRPSCDVLFHSVANEWGNNAIGMIMTGMGEDGADGLGAMRAAGAMTVAQDEASCVVYGMPKAAIDRGSVQRTVSLDLMANTLIVHCQPDRVVKAG